jgi:hypothetical protein
MSPGVDHEIEEPGKTQRQQYQHAWPLGPKLLEISDQFRQIHALQMYAKMPKNESLPLTLPRPGLSLCILTSDCHRDPNQAVVPSSYKR